MSRTWRMMEMTHEEDDDDVVCDVHKDDGV